MEGALWIYVEWIEWIEIAEIVCRQSEICLELAKMSIWILDVS